MKVSNALLGLAVTAAVSIATSAPAIAAELTPDLQASAPLGNHPAVIVAKRTPGFDPAAHRYRHPAGGEAIAPAATNTIADSFSNGYVHVADGVGAAQAQAMLQVVARHVAQTGLGGVAHALPHLTVRVRASYVIEDKVITEVQRSGRFDGQYQGVSGHGGLVSESRMEIYQIADGKVVENWTAVGAPSIEQQLAWAVEGSSQLAE